MSYQYDKLYGINSKIIQYTYDPNLRWPNHLSECLTSSNDSKIKNLKIKLKCISSTNEVSLISKNILIKRFVT